MASASLGRDWLSGLNPAQLEAVEHVSGPILVLAGAGSGKTRVLTVRIARLIDAHGVAPERIFAVTFTNRAANEMKERVAGLLERDPAGLWIGTFHALSARLLRREAEHLGFSRGFTIYDEDDRLALIKRIMEARNHSPRTFAPRSVQAVISTAKNRMQSAEALAASAAGDPLLGVAADVYGALAQALRARNAMDFDDLMLHPLRLFEQHPGRLARWRERFQFILVDEFQDTNRAQYELIRHLGGHGNVFAVGDDDQSIYGWRGAEVRNMRDFQGDFDPVRLVRLEENYRSTQIVLDAANGVITENQSRLGKTLRTRRRGGEAVTLLGASDERDEAEWIAMELSRRVQAGDWSASEAAVLYRTNAQSRAFEEAFRRAGMPYRVVGATSFYDRREVKDLLAYLRLVVNPADNEAFLRAVAVPRRGIGDSSLAVLAESGAAWKHSLLDTSALADRIPGLRPNVRDAFRGFARLVAELQALSADVSPGVVVEELVRRIDYEQLLLREGHEGADRFDNVRELIAAAAEWSEVVEEGAEGTPLARFLEEAALLTAQDKEEGAEQGVTLMTMHTAKGLEWPVVVVAGLEDGLFPLARSLDTSEALEEERRLFYVALTRAKDKLYLSWARTRRRGGEVRPGIPSRFLPAIPPGIVEERRTSTLWSTPAFGSPRGRSGPPRWTGEARAPARGWAQPASVAPEELSQDAPRYVKGERVRHRRFGTGTIEGLSGAGKDLKAIVRFDAEEHGLKRLLVAYAGLERVWEEE